MAKQTPQISLVFVGLVRTETNVRSSIDQRVRVNRVTAEYRGSDGEIYRKSFECKGQAEVPPSGTHAELNNKKQQW